MAVPKRRHSKQRTRTKRAQWKLAAPAVVECPQCKKPKLPHRLCASCGYYNGLKLTLSADEKARLKAKRSS